jgi:hypothetical protein
VGMPRGVSEGTSKGAACSGSDALRDGYNSLCMCGVRGFEE